MPETVKAAPDAVVKAQDRWGLKAALGLPLLLFGLWFFLPAVAATFGLRPVRISNIANFGFLLIGTALTVKALYLLLGSASPVGSLGLTSPGDRRRPDLGSARLLLLLTTAVTFGGAVAVFVGASNAAKASALASGWNRYGAISLADGKVVGLSWRFETPNAAMLRAQAECEERRGVGCHVARLLHNQCAAVVTSQGGERRLGMGSDDAHAVQNAQSQCRDNACVVTDRVCSSGPI